MKEMQNEQNEACGVSNAPKRLRRYATVGFFVLCVVALAFGLRLTWAAYTGNAYLKAVEVTNATQSLFSSDMLVGYYSDPSSIDTASVVVDPIDGTCSFTFSVYNCLLDDRQVVNDKDIPYILSVSATGAGDWSISCDSESNPTGAVVTLPGNRATVKTYTITFPESALGSAVFTVKASVDTSASNIGTKLTCLAAKIVPSERSTVKAASVSGKLVDEAGTFSDYDAYNYLITVTGIETKVELAWNASVVELDPYFSVKYADVVVDAAKGTAAFTMQPGSTIVNFYRVSSASPTNWDNLKISVEKAE